MVLAGISVNYLNDLYIIRNEAPTAQRYRNEILNMLCFFNVAAIEKIFLLLFILPCAFADIECPGGVICSSAQKCCKVNGQYECCNLDVDMPEKDGMVYAGMALQRASPSYQNNSEIVNQNGFGSCSPFNCNGKCCSDYSCCPLFNGVCCSSNRCCPMLSKCCGDGCCGYMGECCGNGCCSDSQRCCDGWCCKKSQRCGARYFSCIGAAGVFSPALTSVLTLVVTTLAFKSFLL
ncbi:uncharacterized protein TNCT_513951 [Trichonephila clavata]|uniref:Uncharacterized protein n=1 Tax=Trichonephila clavata TaxID=2740835 RepID=A0A8X6FF31_TRICU|nr:uncharacterized protein TNCT_513951 [Trichonephila clavata]